MYFTLTLNHVQNSLLMVHFSQTLSLSVPITLFFHPKKPPVSQAYFLCLHKMQFQSSYLLYWKHTSYFPWATMNWLFFFLQVGPFLIVSQNKLFFTSQNARPLLLRLTYFRILSKQLLWLGKVAPGPPSRNCCHYRQCHPVLKGGYQPGSAL